MAKTRIICVEFFLDVARQKLLKSAMFHGAIQKIKVARFLDHAVGLRILDTSLLLDGLTTVWLDGL